MEPGFLAAGVDFERANAARMYDYYLGGAHNFAVDREQAERVIAGHPNTRHLARANRAFLGRVVRWCVERGVDQFLDLGSGVPTVGNVHEIAHAANPEARVAYVDFEPVAVAHAEQIIAGLGTDRVTVTRADMREPARVLSAPGVVDLLDLRRPVALLAMAVLHFVEADAGALLGRYHAGLASGSVVALSHTSDDNDDPEVVAHIHAMRDAYRDSATSLVLRDRAQLRAALDGLELVEPGVVDVTQWPVPQGGPGTSVYGAVALVP